LWLYTTQIAGGKVGGNTVKHRGQQRRQHGPALGPFIEAELVVYQNQNAQEAQTQAQNAAGCQALF
jgi:hypothetical protein